MDSLYFAGESAVVERNDEVLEKVIHAQKRRNGKVVFERGCDPYGVRQEQKSDRLNAVQSVSPYGAHGLTSGARQRNVSANTVEEGFVSCEERKRVSI